MNITRRMLAVLALVIFAGTTWLHWPAVQGRLLVGMDDDEYPRRALLVKGSNWDAVKWALTSTQGFYHPVSRLSHILDYLIWGTNPAGHHATNVVLHALNAVLVFGFLWTLLGAVESLTMSERLIVAFAVAVVFAIHPLQVESVAWLSERLQLLCGTFVIGAAWAYVAGARPWVVTALFIAALLSKPMAMSLPFAMLALDYFPLRRHKRFGWGRLLRDKTVWITLSVAMAVATVITESHPDGLMVPAGTIRPWDRLSLAAQSLTFYPWKLAWPAWLSPCYPLGARFSLQPPLILGSVVCVGVVTALSVWYRRRLPALVAAWAAYVAFILPVSGLAQSGGQAVADRYAYVAMLPLLLLAGGAMVWSWRHCPTFIRVVLGGLLVCEFCFFGLRTREQTLVWHNDETLWRGVLAQFPDSVTANGMLAQLLSSQGRLQEAVEYWQRTARIAPRSAAAHNNLGIALSEAGKLEEAVGEYEQAVKINPDYTEAHYNLGVASAQLGRVPEAIKQYEEALRIEPGLTDAQNRLRRLRAAQ